MNRASICVISIIVAATISACTLGKKSASNEASTPSAQSNSNQAPATSQTAQPQTQAGDLQLGQASGTYTAKGETVELKYAYAGRAERFGDEAIIILLTDKPIPPEAVAEEIKETTLLEGDKVRGLEYAIMEDGMWVRFHPSQYQESGTMKIKDYKVEGDIVSGTDETDGGFSDEKYKRSVKFVASIVK